MILHGVKKSDLRSHLTTVIMPNLAVMLNLAQGLTWFSEQDRSVMATF